MKCPWSIRVRVAITLVGIVFLSLLPSLEGQLAGCLLSKLSQDSDELQQQAERDRQIADRFLSVLKQNPRRGTALDRIYGHHLEYGTLDAFIDSLRVEANQQDDGATWMVLGMLESHRGQDGAAIEALKRAQQQRPRDPLASYYLGLSQLMVGLNDDAVQSFEQAIERGPNRSDAIEIYQQLGRVHARAQRQELALEVWERLEQEFPNDPRVVEQIAITLKEEELFERAKSRYQQLLQLVEDDYRKSTYRIELAELQLQLGDQQQALATFEGILADLNPDGWLFRDVRHRIEELFLRKGNQAALIDYYLAWLKTHPDDIDAMGRVARFQAANSRIEEANRWLETAIARAPTRIDLRKTYIRQLIDENRFEQAIQQFELLAKLSPGDMDVYREWGKTILQSSDSLTVELRKQATDVWRKILELRPDDALTMVQVAELFRQHDLQEEALELYQNAVDQDPNVSRYREYLGEYYHQLKRPQDAIKAWAAIAADDRRNSESLLRLSEIYENYEYTNEALSAIQAAIQLTPNDFELRHRAALLFAETEQAEQALEMLRTAEPLASSEAEVELLITDEIRLLLAIRQLDDFAKAYAEELSKTSKPTAFQWRRLALYHQARYDSSAALSAIRKAIELEPNSIQVLGTAQALAVEDGNLAEAVAFSYRLAEIDRRGQKLHYQNIARLERQLGRIEESLEAGEKLIEISPGNPDSYTFYAELCFSVGEVERAIEALRRAVRANPDLVELRVNLASTLAAQLRTREAIEVYWQAFESAEEIEQRLPLVTELVELYQQVGQFDLLLERLQRAQLNDDQRQAATFCLAHAHKSVDDFGTARSILESLVTENEKDSELLNQLALLSEAEGDLEAAVGYLDELIEVAPDPATEYRLVKLLTELGEDQEASLITAKLVRQETDPRRLLNSLDALLNDDKFTTALEVIDAGTCIDSDNWELLFREASALEGQGRSDQAIDRYRHLIEMVVDLDELSLDEQARVADYKQRAQARAQGGLSSFFAGPPKAIQLLEGMGRTVQSYGFASGYPTSTNSFGSPDSYANARLLSHLKIWRLLKDEQTRIEYVDSILSSGQQANATRAAIYDALALAKYKPDEEVEFELLKRLARSGTTAEKMAYVSKIDQLANQRKSSNEQESTSSKLRQLTDDDIDLLLQCAAQIEEADRHSDRIAGTLVATFNGVRWRRLPDGTLQSAGRGVPYDSIVDELRGAGRLTQAEDLLQSIIDSSIASIQIGEVIRYHVSREQFEQAEDLLPIYHQMALQDVDQWQPKTQFDVTDSPLKQIGDSLESLMDWYATNDRPDHVLAIYRAVAEPEAIVATKVLAKIQASPNEIIATNTVRRSQIRIIVNGSPERLDIQFPWPNAIISRGSITSLRQTYESLNIINGLDQLREFLILRSQQADPLEKAFWLTQLAGYYWWEGETSTAVERYQQVAELFPKNSTALFELANLYLANEDFEKAIATLDSIRPQNQAMLREREALVLKVSERVGNVDRAAEAAEVLFGLRLDQEAQIELSERMRRLGMNDLAKSLSNRIRREMGNRNEALPFLLAEFKEQGDDDRAAEIAFMILRRTTYRSGLITTNRWSNSPLVYYREEAIQILNQHGQLDAEIARLEDQVARQSRNLRPYNVLAEYYDVLERDEDVIRVLSSARETLPFNPDLMETLAYRYASADQDQLAYELYLELLESHPEAVLSRIDQIANTARKIDAVSDFAQRLIEIDFRSYRSAPNQFDRFIFQLLKSGSTQPIGEKLLVHLIEQWPSYSGRIVSRFSANDEFFMTDFLFGKLCDAFFPEERSSFITAWHGFDPIGVTYSTDQSKCFAEEILNFANTPERRETIQKSIKLTAAENPQWTGGLVLLAILDSRSDRVEVARTKLLQLIETDEMVRPIPAYAASWIAREVLALEAVPGDYRDAYVRLLEHSVRTNDRTYDLVNSPIVPLLKTYQRFGDTLKAKQLIQNAVLRGESSRDISYGAKQFLDELASGSLEIDIQGLEVEILYGLIQVLNDSNGSINSGSRSSLYSGFGSSKQRKELPELILDLYRRGDVEFQMKVGRELLELFQSINSEGLSIDVQWTNSRERNDLPFPSLDSILVEIFTTGANNASVAETIVRGLHELEQEGRPSLTIQILIAAASLESGGQLAEREVHSLLDHLRQYPIRVRRQQGTLTERQEAQVNEHVGVWFVAKRCLQRDEFYDEGTQLGELALKAAQVAGFDNRLGSILIEWIELDLANGRERLAEERLRRLIRISAGDSSDEEVESSPAAKVLNQNSNTLNQPRDTYLFDREDLEPLRRVLLDETVDRSYAQFAKREMINDQRHQAVNVRQEVAGSNSAGWQIPRFTSLLLSGLSPLNQGVLVSNQDPADSTVTQRRPLTLPQFSQVMTLAEYAAKNNMSDVSIDAVRRAFRDGPPVLEISNRALGRGGLSSSYSSGALAIGGAYSSGGLGNGSTSEDPIQRTLNHAFRNLSTAWEQSEVDPLKAYEVLLPVVLSSEQPGTFMFYSNAIRVTDDELPCVADVLCYWTVKAGRVDELLDLIDTHATIEESRDQSQSLKALLLLHHTRMSPNETTEAQRAMLISLLTEITSHLSDNGGDGESEREGDPQSDGEQESIPLFVSLGLLGLSSEDFQEICFPLTKRMAMQCVQDDPDWEWGSYELDPLLQRYTQSLSLHDRDDELKSFYEHIIVTGMKYLEGEPSYFLSEMRASMIREIAGDAAANHETEICIEYLTRHYDEPDVIRETWEMREAFGLLASHFNQFPPAERYQLWHDWVMPDKEPKTYRHISAAYDTRRLGGQRNGHDSEQEAVMSTSNETGWRYSNSMLELVLAAKDANQLENLINELANQRTESRDETLIWLLAHVENDQFDLIRDELFDYFLTEGDDEGPWRYDEKDRIEVGRVVLLTAMLERVGLTDESMALCERLRKSMGPYAGEEQSYLLTALLNAARAKTGSTDVETRLNLKHWVTSPFPLGAPKLVAGTIQPFENSLHFEPAPAISILYSRYPIEGEYRVEFDLSGTGRMSKVVFGPAGLMVGDGDQHAVLMPANQKDNVQLRGGEFAAGNHLSHVRFEVSDEMVSCYLNSILIAQTPNRHAFPWLSAMAYHGHPTAISNLRIEGNYSIPSTVDLIQQNSLIGWSVMAPQDLAFPVLRTGNQVEHGNLPAVDSESSDINWERINWSVKAGELVGKSATSKTALIPHWLRHMRPLQAHESIRCQFYYEPGNVEFTPTFGMTAYQLKPDSIDSADLHPLREDQAYFVGEPLKVRVQFVPTTFQQRPNLKANDWNHFEIRRDEQAFRFFINDEVVLTESIRGEEDAVFGFFHQPEHQTRIREIEWHAANETRIEDFEEIAWFEPLYDISPAEQLAMELVAGSHSHDFEIEPLVQKCRGLSPEQAYQRLIEWVMPIPDQSLIRLNHAYARAVPAGRSDWFLEDTEPLSPAWELAKLAAELERTDELMKQLKQLEAGQNGNEIDLLAFQSLVLQADGQTEEAQERLDRILAKLPAAEPTELAIKLPMFRKALTQLGLFGASPGIKLQIAEHLRPVYEVVASDERLTDQDRFLLETLTGIPLKHAHVSSESNESRSIWFPVLEASLHTRHTEDPPAEWIVEANRIVQLPGDGPAPLLLTIPLTGEFEVHAVQDLDERNHIAIGYDFQAFSPKFGNRRSFQSKLFSRRSDSSSLEDAAQMGLNIPWKISVDANRTMTMVSEQQVGLRALNPSPAPWVFLVPRSHEAIAQIKDLRISGTPIIPESIELIKPSQFPGWQAVTRNAAISVHAGREDSEVPFATYYPSSERAKDWQFREQELITEPLPEAITPLESLITYFRPMLEDGVLEYEFFYQPNEYEVHPAVGLNAFLFSVDGVWQHQITNPLDGEQSLDRNNRVLLEREQSEPMPLISNDWNRCRIELNGDQLLIFLNDKKVGESQLDIPKSERTIGLYRSQANTRARVRNMNYRGEWPRQLPEFLTHSSN